MKTKIMGILNVTPDSFYAESCYDTCDLATAKSHALHLVAHGAEIIDIGGESTRPGGMRVSLKEELKRVIPIIKELRTCLSLPISIDTMKAEVAIAAIEAGASLINDVSGFCSLKMREAAAHFQTNVCTVHRKKHPSHLILKGTLYPEGIIPTLLKWFDASVRKLLRSGIREQNIILDPGIGFGKTVADNFEILNNLSTLKAFGFPILLGISRKSFMSKILNLPPHELLPGTLALNSLAIRAGVDYIRVHDVKEHHEAALLINQLQLYE